MPPSAPRANRTHGKRPGALAGATVIFGWLVYTLAAGVLAAFAAILLGPRPCWLILVLALPLTWVLWLSGCVPARWAWAVAALGVLVAGFYATCLDAIARIGIATGTSIGAAFHKGGIGLVLQVAALGFDAEAIGVYAVAVVIAALLATRLTRGSSKRS